MIQAKEKANELANKFVFKSVFDMDNKELAEARKQGKQCALICVDEILKTLAELLPYGVDYLQKRDELLEVKQEIEKL